MPCHTSSFFFFFSGCAHLSIVHICQRLLSLSVLAKSIDFKLVFGEVYNVLFSKFKLDSQRCRAFMLDGCTANLKALLTLTTRCANAVGMRCMAQPLQQRRRPGRKQADRQLDRRAADGPFRQRQRFGAVACCNQHGASESPFPPLDFEVQEERPVCDGLATYEEVRRRLQHQG